MVVWQRDQWTQLWNQIYIWTKKLTTADLQLNQTHLKNKWLIMQWLCPCGKFKLATVKNKEPSKKIPKNEPTLHGNTSGAFLKIWDWMKITLLHSLSLTFRAHRHLQSCLEVRVGFRCSFSCIKEGDFPQFRKKSSMSFQIGKQPGVWYQQAHGLQGLIGASIYGTSPHRPLYKQHAKSVP